MSTSRRRVPGWVLVLVLVVVGLLAALPVFLLGPTSRFGPPILLLRATSNIAATPANVTVPADFGPLCSDYTWDERRRFLAVESDADLTGPEGLLLQTFTPLTANFVTTNGNFVRTVFSAGGATWRLTSPIDDHTLATFVVSGANVTVDGTTHGPGETWSLHFEYDVAMADATVHITEDIDVRNEGVVQPRIVPARPCA